MLLCVQISVLESEQEVLEESAATANLKVQETREAMAAQAKQLGQLQYLPPRLQDMQEQVQACAGHATLERLDSSMFGSLQAESAGKAKVNQLCKELAFVSTCVFVQPAIQPKPLNNIGSLSVWAWVRFA